MSKVIVMSRKQANYYSYDNKNVKTAMISITDPGSSDNNIKIDDCNVAFLLRCKFADVSDTKDNGITKEQAKQIATFVKKHYGNVEQIIVHCEAGISRSAGVAAAILKYFTNDDSQIFDSYKYRPNTLCYRNVLEALYDE